MKSERTFIMKRIIMILMCVVVLGAFSGCEDKVKNKEVEKERTKINDLCSKYSDEYGSDIVILTIDEYNDDVKTAYKSIVSDLSAGNFYRAFDTYLNEIKGYYK